MKQNGGGTLKEGNYDHWKTKRKSFTGQGEEEVREQDEMGERMRK